jgi:hypothetical protein
VADPASPHGVNAEQWREEIASNAGCCVFDFLATDLCRYVQQAYRVALPPWKAIAGANWNKEEGVGHLEGSSAAEAVKASGAKVK